MKLVVDSNILFTFFWKKSVARELFSIQDLELYSPEFALEEIEKYSKDIMHKANISEKEFNLTREELKIFVRFVKIEEYSDFLKQSAKITPDKNDVDFFALSLRLNCQIWSNDNLLKNQEKIKVLTTKEIIDLMDY